MIDCHRLDRQTQYNLEHGKGKKILGARKRKGKIYLPSHMKTT